MIPSGPHDRSHLPPGRADDGGEEAGRIWRDQLTRQDREIVREIVTATRFFRADEVDVAVELVDERLARGEASGYHFVFCDDAGVTAGYACYGPIACARGAYDLYWIAVAPSHQQQGIGRALLGHVEYRIRTAGGRQIYVETSGRPQYEPTRAFYGRHGYEVAAVLPDFYDVGDDKVILRKLITGSAA